MDGKTCGTCAHGKPALVKCVIHRDEFPWLKKQKETCGDWAERTDSVEQVVSEMLGCICQLSEDYGGCLGDGTVGMPPCEHAGERRPCYEAFEERLRALGVVE